MIDSLVEYLVNSGLPEPNVTESLGRTHFWWYEMSIVRLTDDLTRVGGGFTSFSIDETSEEDRRKLIEIYYRENLKRL